MQGLGIEPQLVQQSSGSEALIGINLHKCSLHSQKINEKPWSN